MKTMTMMVLLALMPVSAFAQVISVGVKGMTCEGCATTVKASLEQVPEVKSVAIDVEGARADVTLKDVNAVPSDDALKAAVVKAGYMPGDVM